MATLIQIGDEVGWPWAGSVAVGIVIDIKSERTQIESKGSLITRNGSDNDPAVIIEQANGTMVLKLAHELQRLQDDSNQHD